MMELLLYLLFFGPPVAAIAFFCSSLAKYKAAKKNGCDEAEIKKRKLLLALSSVIASILVAAVISIMVLLYMAIAYM